VPDQTRQFLSGQLDESDDVSTIEASMPGATLALVRRFIENFNSQMDELTKKLLESDEKGYTGIIKGIKDLQTYLKALVEVSSDPNAKNAPPLRDLPKTIEKALQDTADRLRKEILGDQPGAVAASSDLATRLDKLLGELEKDRTERAARDQETRNSSPAPRTRHPRTGHLPSMRPRLLLTRYAMR
jgi:hypothetical protein